MRRRSLPYLASLWILMLMIPSLVVSFLPKTTNSPRILKSLVSLSNSLAFLSSRHQSQTMTDATSTKRSVLPSNQELVEHRLQVAREKEQSRRLSVQREQERNLRLKSLLQNKNRTEEYAIPELYALKVSVCENLRQELKLSGREKRGRVFVEQSSNATRSLRALKFELHAFFRALRKSTFLLSAGYPTLAADGSIVSAPNNGTYWKIESDDDVVRTFRAADEYFKEQSQVLKRPSIVIHVEKDPNAPEPPPPKAYLQNLPDPAQSPTMTMLSFYSFPPDGIADPEDFSVLLRKMWKPFQALGRVYVAQEGVNAQMSVPTTVLDQFMECCRDIPQLGRYMENDINIDPVPLTRDEFSVAGVPAAGGKPLPPFTALHIRVRRQVVADGLDRPLDWQSAGYDMPPMEWHEQLKQQRKNDDDASNRILLDCRNSYETDVGRFEGAEPLGTENFRESWDVLKERLKDTPKDTPISAYCTGGIRCVKVGAYLTQELGFTNVSRLAGGIIAYDRILAEQAPEEESIFKGTNFVFDGRLGRAITDDSLGTCVTCGEVTSLVSNCRNDNCHKRMVQCEECRTSFLGTCSDACRQRLVNGVMASQRGLATKASNNDDTATPPTLYTSLDDYSSGHSSPPPSIYREIEFNSRALIPSGSHMVSGSAQGRLLTQLASMTREGRILELGTFTGYTAACLLEGAANAGRATGVSESGGRDRGPYVMTMERDARAFDVAAAHLKCMAEYGTGEAAAEALCGLRSDGSVPVVEEEIVSLNFEDVAGCELVRVSDALASVESMSAGTSELQPAPFDMVFIDADKTRLLEYVEACLSSDRVLKKGGLIIVDNVLWKGLVLEANNGDFSSLSSDEESENEEVRKNRRARKLANKMHRFNSQLVKDERVEVLVLPVRDGLSVIRKR